MKSYDERVDLFWMPKSRPRIHWNSKEMMGERQEWKASMWVPMATHKKAGWTACSHFGRGPLGLEFYDTVEILLKRDHNWTPAKLNEDRALTSRILKGLYLTCHSICGYPEFLVLSRCSSICSPLTHPHALSTPSCVAAGPSSALEQVHLTGQVLESVMTRGMKSTSAVPSRNWNSPLPTPHHWPSKR